MIPDNFWAIVGELSAYTVFPALTTYIFMHFVTGYFGRLAAVRRYLEIIDGAATTETKPPMRLEGDPSNIIESQARYD